MWVINDAIKFFPVSLISDSISTVSIIIAIFRYDILTKQGKIVKKSIEENPVEDLPVEQISESK